MKTLTNLALMGIFVAFVISLSSVTASAQPGWARWQGNNGRHLGWTNGRHRGWERERRREIRRYQQSRYYGYNSYPSYGYQTYGYNNYGYNPYRRSTGTTILSYVLGGRNYRYNRGYYGSSYLTAKQRRKMYRRYVRDVRRDQRRYAW